MTKCIFCNIEEEFTESNYGAPIGNKGTGICGKCMEWLEYYIKRNDSNRKYEKNNMS